MDLAAAGLKEQPFATHGKPLVVVPYAARNAALEMLAETFEHRTGLSLLQGPSLSGKSTILRAFVASLPGDSSVAMINGKGLNTGDLLVSILRQFGYDPDLGSTNELLGLVRVFALQQASSHRAPLLIIENAQELNPSALRTLCELAELRVRTGSALKIILASDRSLQAMMNAAAMSGISKRLVHNFHLRPMNRGETRTFLHTKLRMAGSSYPEFVLPDEICEDIWRASAGWPGITDRIALLALAQTDALPVGIADIEHPALPVGTWDAPTEPAFNMDAADNSPPRLIVTNNGSIMTDMTVTRSRVLIGRSEHNDISINSRFISRHHALLVRHGSTTVLMDLNSSNGTSVNSRRISNHILLHDDVITLGHHRIKFYDPFATADRVLDHADFDDTAIMKTLQDMRNLLARENTALLPSASEELPTIKT